MTDAPSSTTGMKKTLGLTGVTVNAMALIAPGAFLWITYQLQAANVDSAGNSTAHDMWTGIVVALIVAFLTAFAYSELARRYPEAGTGSAYYFSEKAFLDREEPSHRRWARIFKFVTGWAAHLFYWVYPGVMVAFMATLITYIASQFGIAIPLVGQIIIACLFSALVGYIAIRGITGSTNVAIAINIIQLTTLVIFSVLAIAFRNSNPLHVDASGWYFQGGGDIVNPLAQLHTMAGLLFQSTIAILILVGFESSTALAAEAKNPRRDIPRAVILSLLIQGVFAYLFEYFSANYALGSWLGNDVAGKGINAAAASGAPIGDMAIKIGNSMLGGNGFALMIVLAISVAIAILGTTLAAMNTGVRISFAMAQDKEMPELMGALHGRFATPHMGLVVMVIVSAVIGAIGLVGGAVTLTGITLASNLGTFVLYGIICAVTIVAFAGRKEFHRIRHLTVPVLGLIGNIIMVGAIFIIGIATGGTTAQETYLGLGISALWLIVSVVYFVINSRQTGKAIIPTVEAMRGVGD
ncbi:MAG TPA: APC family permease [Phototrophicaceae bacterium]|nr:APC family permease [Phototrophicaceae bacterium]